VHELPSGTVTFLFTDVEGSTRLLHELGAKAYARALAEHRQVVREACAAHGGVEVDTQGDAFFFVFPTAPRALEAAHAMTEGLAPGPIRIRVGLHTGAPLVTEEGYVGHDVHFAARVAASAHGGQVVFSRATRDVLDDEFALADLGEHRLKDVEGPVSIFQLGTGTFPPLKTISNTNLPRPASSFVGRERELNALLARVEGGARLVTLTGPGGSGKTRLALEAAASLVPEYKAGVFWVGLAALRDPALVLESVSQTLGAKDGLAEHIGEREMLLLLDNLEQVIEAALDLSSLVTACPNLTLLVTSRELLRIQGEVEYSVPPMAQPEALSLFCERAQVEPSEEIGDLCTRLDSLPLAVELAAARAKALSPAQILERVSQRLDLLKGGRDADPRQRTLRATIEWSYDLLSEAEQRLFSRLSVFSGGCTLEAAEEVASADLETLQSLVEKSLLRYSNERYWMLETIHEYASEKREEAGQPKTLQDRHAAFYLRAAEEMASGLRGQDQRRLLSVVERDLDNFRAAFSWLAAGEDWVALLRLSTALSDFWWQRGRPLEGRDWILSALARNPDPTPLRAEALRAASELGGDAGDPAARDLALESVALSRQLGLIRLSARCLNNLGLFELEAGKVDAAARLFRESAAIRREQGDQIGLGRTLVNLALAEAKMGNFEQARGLLEECLGLDDDPFGRAVTFTNLAGLALQMNDPAAATRWYGQALSVFSELQALRAVSRVVVSLARIAVDDAEWRRACCLLGAASRLEESVDPILDQDFLDEKREALDALRRSLDATDFEVAWNEGHAMSLEEVVAYALEPVDVPIQSRFT
jgi:predicted ATPase